MQDATGLAQGAFHGAGVQAMPEDKVKATEEYIRTNYKDRPPFVCTKKSDASLGMVFHCMP